MAILDAFPKPFLDDLVRGRCLPIVGAGFSKNANVPPDKHMPDWVQLAATLGDKLPYAIETGNPIDIISAYEHEYSRPKLIEELSEALHMGVVQPGEAHKAFNRLPFDVVVTTNFDNLLEAGYDAVGKARRLVLFEDNLAIGANSQTVTVVKLHGDLDHPTRLIATEDDYDLFLSRYPLMATYLANLLITRTPLFIGYSLEDPDFRSIWQIIGARLGKLRRAAYVLTMGATPLTVSRYARRGVKVINIARPREAFGQSLTEAFSEMATHWKERLPKEGVALTLSTKAELALPPGIQTTLCYFSIPTELRAFYNGEVFPIFQRYGLTPLWPDDLLSTGDSVLAKVDALLSRSRAGIFEASSPNLLFELGSIRGRIQAPEVLVIAETGQPLPDLLADQTIIIRPPLDVAWATAVWKEFFDQLATWAAKVASKGLPQPSEPERLLEKKEYRAAVISAFAVLESHLKRLVGLQTQPSPIVTLRDLLQHAKDVLPPDKLLEIEVARQLRNVAAHSERGIAPRQARRMVQTVLDLVKVIDQRIGEAAVGSSDKS